MATSYELVHVNRLGHELTHPYTSENPLEPGAVVRFDGRDWLVESVQESRVQLKPARYRLRLRHPDGREDLGGFRRYRPDAPRVGHTFSTLEDGVPITWQVADERLAEDESGEPYLDLTAERDYSEAEDPPTLPEHELEHALARDDEDREAAAAFLARAEEAGQFVELVALEPGEAPDWAEAEAYIDALELEEIEDDLLEQCGVPDLERFRADIEGEEDEIEVWGFRDGRVFAAVGSFEDEANPDSPHGWMIRLIDASALRAAGFSWARKATLSA